MVEQKEKRRKGTVPPSVSGRRPYPPGQVRKENGLPGRGRLPNGDPPSWMLWGEEDRHTGQVR